MIVCLALTFIYEFFPKYARWPPTIRIQTFERNTTTFLKSAASPNLIRDNPSEPIFLHFFRCTFG